MTCTPSVAYREPSSLKRPIHLLDRPRVYYLAALTSPADGPYRLYDAVTDNMVGVVKVDGGAAVRGGDLDHIARFERRAAIAFEVAMLF